MLKKISLKKIAYLIVMLMFFIFPTSINKIPYSVKGTVVLWAFFSLLIFFFALYEKIEMKQVLLVLFCMLYLFVITMVAMSDDGLHISLARIAPLVCFFSLCCISHKSQIDARFFVTLLDIMCVIMIVWNLLTLLRVQSFIEFVNRFYTQLDTYTATYWSLVNNKPIFTFGVHNFASIFYMHIFLFAFYAYDVYKKKRFVVYMISIMVFTLLLKASSSAGILCVMILFFLKLFLSDKRKIYILTVCGVVAIFALSQSNLVEAYVKAFSSKANGFFARYSSETSLYEANYSILEEFPLGIGFTIGQPDMNIYFGDSGYIIYYTMGGLVLSVLLFILIYRYFKINLGRKMAITLSLVVALTELSLISFMYEKTLYLYIFEVGFFKSILNSSEAQQKRRVLDA